MEALPGTAYIMARTVSMVQPPESVSRQRNTVKDLAKHVIRIKYFMSSLVDFRRYFAQSWKWEQQLSPTDTATLFAEFRSKLNLLSQSLPSQFLPNLNKVYEKLPSLFSGALPLVLSHGDLCEMNLLVSPETGNITGVVDWAEGRILPFGLSLWGVENILGFMDPRGWHFYDNRHELKDLFWRTLWSEAEDDTKVDMGLIQTARMVGLFCRYGLVMEGKDLKGTIDYLDSYSSAYLDAFCTADEWEPTRRKSK